MLCELRHKIRSERGASLSMALMLFLVVTTVAAIVLAAATASSGRLAQLRDMNRSYYSITSAMELVWGELKDLRADGSSVSIERAYDPETKTWSAKIGDISLDATGTKLTLFQAAVFDLMLSSAGYSSPQSLSSSRSAGSAVIGSTMALPSQLDTDGGFDDVSPKEIVWEKHEYEPITISAPAGFEDTFVPVQMTVYRNTDRTFSFVFSQDTPQSPVFTLVASVGFTDPSPAPGMMEWGTNVMWTPMYITEGSHHE